MALDSAAEAGESTASAITLEPRKRYSPAWGVVSDALGEMELVDTTAYAILRCESTLRLDAGKVSVALVVPAVGVASSARR